MPKVVEPTAKTMLSPSAIIYHDAVKKSQRARWTDHFTLQLRGYGFMIFSKADRDLNKVGPLTAHTVFAEYKFHPDRLWRIDFAFPFQKISVEIEGGIWMKGGGAHSRPMNIMRDVEKQNALVLLGWKPLRFSDKEIRAGESVATLMKLANL